MFYVSKVSLLFFLLALIGLFLSLVLKATSLDFTHYGKLAVFGFILPTILGAFYQIIPNSQQQKLHSEWIGYIVFVLSVLNLYYLYINDFEKSSFFIVAISLLTVIHLAFVIKNLKPLTVKFLVFANIFMVLSAVFLLLSVKNPQFSLQIAIHTFTIGVMVNAVLGVQTAWIPMIYMRQLGETKVAKLFLSLSVYLHQIIILGVLTGFYFGNYKLVSGFALIELAFIILFLKFVFYDSIKPQLKLHGIPYQIKFFLTGQILLIVGLVIAHIIGISNKFELIPYHIDFMVYGFAVFTIIGGMVHLSPRIIWNLVYIKKAQAMKQIPNVKGVISRNKAEKLYIVALAGYITFLVLDFMFGNTISSLVYITILFIVIFGFLIDFYRLYVL